MSALPAPAMYLDHGRNFAIESDAQQESSREFLRGFENRAATKWCDLSFPVTKLDTDGPTDDA